MKKEIIGKVKQLYMDAEPEIKNIKSLVIIGLTEDNTNQDGCNTSTLFAAEGGSLDIMESLLGALVNSEIFQTATMVALLTLSNAGDGKSVADMMRKYRESDLPSYLKEEINNLITRQMQPKGAEVRCQDNGTL